MSKNALIINGHQHWEISKGELTDTLVSIARAKLESKGYQVRVTVVDEDWDVETEIENMVWADFIIFQFPVYWFGVPWGLKKYIDEVYMIGRGRTFENDGRTREDPSRKYGTGGLLHGRKYMLSTTWNAPDEAFNDPDQLFEGKDVDGVFFWFHKANEFCGLTGLPSFSCHDVMKNADVENDLKRWSDHINYVF